MPRGEQAPCHARRVAQAPDFVGAATSRVSAPTRGRPVIATRVSRKRDCAGAVVAGATVVLSAIPSSLPAAPCRSDGRQKLTGLLVNSPDAASVGRRYLAKVRSAIHRFSKLPRAAQITAAESIKGRIVYVRRTNPGAAERLAKQFATVCPQPAA